MSKRRKKITSREMIARALAAQKVERHTKVRMSRDLYDRAAQCAREVDEDGFALAGSLHKDAQPLPGAGGRCSNS